VATISRLFKIVGLFSRNIVFFEGLFVDKRPVVLLRERERERERLLMVGATQRQALQPPHCVKGTLEVKRGSRGGCWKDLMEIGCSSGGSQSREEGEGGGVKREGVGYRVIFHTITLV